MAIYVILAGVVLYIYTLLIYDLLLLLIGPLQSTFRNPKTLTSKCLPGANPKMTWIFLVCSILFIIMCPQNTALGGPQHFLGVNTIPDTFDWMQSVRENLLCILSKTRTREFLAPWCEAIFPIIKHDPWMSDETSVNNRTLHNRHTLFHTLKETQK